MSDADVRREVDTLLTPEELAAQVRKSPRWVKDEARAGRIPHVRVGRSFRFRPDAAEALLRPGGEPEVSVR